MEIFYSVLALLTGIGIFLTGIVMFSECLEKSASRGMRSLFKKISNNRVSGLSVGVGVTALVQSSSATTVMVIGLVNAGILTLFQATSIIMGANIGTTVTGLMVSLSSFKIKYIFMALTFVGAFIKLATKKDNFVRIAELLISFGVLFIGLELMSNAFSDNESLTNAFKTLFEHIEFPLLLILMGAIFTGIIQSSSASTAIFITMVGSILSIKSAMFLVLGANIGTCVTAFLASLTANTNAKRTALIHILFNTIGAILFLIILWPFADKLLPEYTRLIPDSKWQLAVFHLIFNTSTTLVLVFFIKPLNNLTCLLIKEKANDEDIMRTTFIDDRLLSTPSIAIEQTIKEINDMAAKSFECVDLAFNSLIEQDLGQKDRIMKLESKVEFLNQTLAKYLVKLSSSTISYKNEKLIGRYHYVINDIKRIGDHALGILNTATKMKEQDIKFSETATIEVAGLYEKLANLYTIAMNNFVEQDGRKLKNVTKLAEEIADEQITLSNNHIQRLNQNLCTVESGSYFQSVLTSFISITDHLINISSSSKSIIERESKTLKVKVQKNK